MQSAYQNVAAVDNGVTSLRWTDSAPDLKSLQSDPLIESLLERTAPDVVDASNRADRSRSRHESLLALFPPQSEVVLALLLLFLLAMDEIYVTLCALPPVVR